MHSRTFRNEKRQTASNEKVPNGFVSWLFCTSGPLPRQPWKKKQNINKFSILSWYVQYENFLQHVHAPNLATSNSTGERKCASAAQCSRWAQVRWPTEFMMSERLQDGQSASLLVKQGSYFLLKNENLSSVFIRQIPQNSYIRLYPMSNPWPLLHV